MASGSVNGYREGDSHVTVAAVGGALGVEWAAGETEWKGQTAANNHGCWVNLAWLLQFGSGGRRIGRHQRCDGGSQNDGTDQETFHFSPTE